MSGGDTNPVTGKAYAINPQSGVWDDNYFARTYGGQSSGQSSPSSSSGGGNANSYMDEAIKRMQTANQPAVQSLQASIPEIQSQYAQARTQLQGQQPTLEARYNNLLASIKGNQTTAENRQTLTTNTELGKRGLASNTGVGQQELTSALNPITQQYTSLATDTGLQRESAIKALQDQIANLTPQETSDIRAIQNAIAQLRSGAATSGVQTGMNLYSTDLAQSNANREFNSQQSQQAIQNTLAQLSGQKSGLLTLGEGASVYDPTTGRIVATAPKTYKQLQSTVGGNDPLGLGL